MAHTEASRKAREESSAAQQGQALRFATLLGAFRLKNVPDARNNDECLSALFSSNEASTCSVPSLCLKSGHSDDSSTDSADDQDKDKVEEHAASNLAFPLEARNISLRQTGTDSTQNVKTVMGHLAIPQLPLQLLDNLADSFVNLLNARLRAYITILANHGVSVAHSKVLSDEEQKEGVLAVENKLSTLVDIGTGVTIDNMVTFFRVGAEQMDGDDEFDLVMPLQMETTIDVMLPTTDAGGQLETVAASAKGVIRASFDDNSSMLKSVEVEIDTHQLLEELIDRASRVMSIVLDHVCAVCALPPQIPPAPFPAHKHEEPTEKPRPVAEQVSQQWNVVSPDHCAVTRPNDIPPPLQLDEESSSNISDLSPECCANIVDFVMGEVDHIIFPPLKKQKLTA